MAKKVTLADVKKKTERLENDLQKLLERQIQQEKQYKEQLEQLKEKYKEQQDQLKEKQKSLEKQLKDIKADYVIMLLEDSNTSVAFLEDLLIPTEQGGEA